MLITNLHRDFFQCPKRIAPRLCFSLSAKLHLVSSWFMCQDTNSRLLCVYRDSQTCDAFRLELSIILHSTHGGKQDKKSLFTFSKSWRKAETCSGCYLRNVWSQKHRLVEAGRDHSGSSLPEVRNVHLMKVFCTRRNKKVQVAILPLLLTWQAEMCVTLAPFQPKGAFPDCHELLKMIQQVSRWHYGVPLASSLPFQLFPWTVGLNAP